MIARRMLVLLVLMVVFAHTAWCTAIFARPLPTDNLNGAGSTRSNFIVNDDCTAGAGSPCTGDWYPFVLGDSALLPAGMWRIDKITTWSVAAAGTTTDLFSSEFQYVTLYTGNTDATLSPFSGPSTHTRVNYTGLANYLQEGSETPYPIWQNEFDLTGIPGGLIVSGGSPFYFAVWGAPLNDAPDGTTGLWFNHYTAAGRAGTTQDSPNGLYLNWDPEAFGAGSVLRNPLTFGFGWPGFDMNVLIEGEAAVIGGEAAVPEPGTFSLLVLGGVALMALRRRVRASAL